METLEFPKCKCCGGSLEPLWFIEEETKTMSNDGFYYTGRKRRNINYLQCVNCGHKEMVDDSFAEPWD